MAVGGLAGGQGALGAFEHPGDVNGLLDEEAVDHVLGLEVGHPGIEAALELRGILAGEDGGLGPHPVLHGVEFGFFLTCGTPGARNFEIICPIGLQALRADGFRHGSCSLRRDED
jgi:hypothetical protein